MSSDPEGGDININYIAPKNDYYMCLHIKHTFLVRKRNLSGKCFFYTPKIMFDIFYRQISK